MTKTIVEKKKSCSPRKMNAAMCDHSAVPQCELRMEACKGGCKIYCNCDDQLACATLHDLCRNMLECPCSVSCMKDGMVICRCEFDCCDCSCEMLADGICITCTTKDKCCAEMIQALCRCLSCCQECGCTSTVLLNKTPVCCCTCC